MGHLQTASASGLQFLLGVLAQASKDIKHPWEHVIIIVWASSSFPLRNPAHCCRYGRKKEKVSGGIG